jgi:hypothetical protein
MALPARVPQGIGSWEIGQLWGTGTSQVPASVWNTCQLLYLQGNRCVTNYLTVAQSFNTLVGIHLTLVSSKGLGAGFETTIEEGFNEEFTKVIDQLEAHLKELEA